MVEYSGGELTGDACKMDIPIPTIFWWHGKSTILQITFTSFVSKSHYEIWLFHLILLDCIKIEENDFQDLQLSFPPLGMCPVPARNSHV